MLEHRIIQIQTMILFEDVQHRLFLFTIMDLCLFVVIIKLKRK
jgi:hypothetical protein